MASTVKAGANSPSQPNNLLKIWPFYLLYWVKVEKIFFGSVPCNTHQSLLFNVPRAFEFCIYTFSAIDSISTETNQFQTIAIKLCCNRHVLCHFFPTFFVGIFSFNIFHTSNILAGIVYNNQFRIDISEYETKLPRVFLRFFSNRVFRSAFFSLSHLTVHTVSAIVYT